MAGRKTHEQQLRSFERRDDVPRSGAVGDGGPARTAKAPRQPKARRSEVDVSFRGMNQESPHNKHNRPEAGAGKTGRRQQR
jgi:hypothetical protein